MEYIFASMLLHKLNQPINEENIKKVLTAAGATPDDAKVKAVVAALDGVDIEKAIKEAAIATTPAPAEEKPKEEKKEEKKDDTQAAAGLGALFG